MQNLVSAAHMSQGETLSTMVSGALEVHASACVALSRVRSRSTVKALQHPPALFAQGPPLGPRVFMQKLRCERTPDAAERAFMDSGPSTGVAKTSVSSEAYTSVE